MRQLVDRNGQVTGGMGELAGVGGWEGSMSHYSTHVRVMDGIRKYLKRLASLMSRPPARPRRSLMRQFAGLTSVRETSTILEMIVKKLSNTMVCACSCMGNRGAGAAPAEIRMQA